MGWSGVALHIKWILFTVRETEPTGASWGLSVALAEDTLSLLTLCVVIVTDCQTEPKCGRRPSGVRLSS